MFKFFSWHKGKKNKFTTKKYKTKKKSKWQVANKTADIIGVMTHHWIWPVGSHCYAFGGLFVKIAYLIYKKNKMYRVFH